jgi:NADPH:quinone reductase-like Zn-dependent oxidoreductase
MPEGLTAVEAASLPLVSLTALQALRDSAGLRPEQRVLVNGASGGVGTAAVQIARALGAHVTGVCSAKNRDLVRELGAERVVDYRVDDFTRQGHTYDIVFDVVANRSYGACRRVLSPDGVYVSLYPSPANAFWWVATKLSRRRALLMDMKPSGAQLEEIAKWVEAGDLRPVIDRVLPLSAAAEAHRRSESKRARGKIVFDLVASQG